MSQRRRRSRLCHQRSTSHEDLTPAWGRRTSVSSHHSRGFCSDDGGEGYMEDDDSDTEQREEQTRRRHKHRPKLKQGDSDDTSPIKTDSFDEMFKYYTRECDLLLENNEQPNRPPVGFSRQHSASPHYSRKRHETYSVKERHHRGDGHGYPRDRLFRQRSHTQPDIYRFEDFVGSSSPDAVPKHPQISRSPMPTKSPKAAIMPQSSPPTSPVISKHRGYFHSSKGDDHRHHDHHHPGNVDDHRHHDHYQFGSVDDHRHHDHAHSGNVDDHRHHDHVHSGNVDDHRHHDHVHSGNIDDHHGHHGHHDRSRSHAHARQLEKADAYPNRVLSHMTPTYVDDPDWEVGAMRPRVASLPTCSPLDRRTPPVAALRQHADVHRVRSYIIAYGNVISTGERYVSNSSVASTESNKSCGTSTKSGNSGGGGSYFRVILTGTDGVGKRAIIQRFLVPADSYETGLSLGKIWFSTLPFRLFSAY